MVAGARNHLNLLFNAPHLRHSDSVVGSQPLVRALAGRMSRQCCSRSLRCDGQEADIASSSVMGEWAIFLFDNREILSGGPPA
jgi:hypothetical protein